MTPPAERKVCAMCFWWNPRFLPVRRDGARPRIGLCAWPDRREYTSEHYRCADFNPTAREGRSDDEQ